MDTDDQMVGRLLSRREVLALFGAAGATAVVGRYAGNLTRFVSNGTAQAAASSTTSAVNAAAVLPSCIVSPALTEGPYYVDVDLNRSDIRSDPGTGEVVEGTQLDLVLHTYQAGSGGCVPLAGAVVDIWHCDALGVYSDTQDPGFDTTGQQFLRGYQVSDENGLVRFTTIYPGWYQGRAVHIHFKVQGDAGSGQSYEFTSQFFFDESVTDVVHAEEPYASKGYRTLFNEGDSIFQEGGSQLMLTLSQSESGYVGTFDIGLQLDGDPQPTASNYFQSTWARTDDPVSTGQTRRTWMWGPAANTEVIWEPYAESPDGQRAVQYYDKARMEITNPSGDPTSLWYVTNGLLVVELVAGQLQTGDASFEPSSPAEVPVAGDSDDASGPTYASFSQVLDQAPHEVGATVIQRIDRAGTLTEDDTLTSQGVTIAIVDSVTNHAIAEPFWTFMNSQGLVYQDGEYVTEALFENPYYATGRPISEPAWAMVQVDGTPRDVLMQCFERRALTYTPGNSEGFVVEAGNVGLHYYSWRYGSAD